MLYRIRKPNVKKIALVRKGANGNTWHLFKEASSSSPPARDVEPDQDEFVELIKSLPTEDAEKVIDGLVASLTKEEANAVVNEIDRYENPPWRAELEAKMADLEQTMATRHARTALAKADGSPATAERELARLLEQGDRAELVRRMARSNAEARERPRHATSYLYAKPTASAEEGADMVLALRRADPKASRPRWRGAF